MNALSMLAELVRAFAHPVRLWRDCRPYAGVCLPPCTAVETEANRRLVEGAVCIRG